MTNTFSRLPIHQHRLKGWFLMCEGHLIALDSCLANDKKGKERLHEKLQHLETLGDPVWIEDEKGERVS